MSIYKGIVEQGSKRAETHGFKTANIPNLDTARSGVYAAIVSIGGKKHNAIGFADTARRVLELHLFDFSADLYGVHIRAELTKKIRDRKKFADMADMKATIAKDVKAVQEYFDL